MTHIGFPLRRRRLRILVAFGLWMSLVAGCSPGATPSTPPTSPPATASASPDSSRPPAPSPGAEFDLVVVPEQMVGRTIGGARVVFLVQASGRVDEGPIDLAVVAPGAAVSIEPQPLTPGVVGEVAIVPEAVDQEVELAVGITATRGEVERTERRIVMLMPGEDSLFGEAGDHLAPFVTWLARERPDLGITGVTAWSATPGGWVLVVNHYLFFSNEWEVGLDWHVMIPPDDWSRIYLRRRWTELQPSLAFEIPSVTSGSEPREIQPPEGVWR